MLCYRSIQKAISASVFVAAAGGCGLHLHSEENAKVAQTAKAEYAEKLDLLSLVQKERENLAKQHAAELAAVRQSQILERDQILLDAAQVDQPGRLNLLELPSDGQGAQIDCTRPLSLPYLARRACELRAPTRTALSQLAARHDQSRQAARLRLVNSGLSDLRQLGWREIPNCTQLPDVIPAEVLDRIAEDSRQKAVDRFAELRRDCSSFRALPPAFHGDEMILSQVIAELAAITNARTEVDEKLKDLATRLKRLSSGQPGAGETRNSLMEAAADLRSIVAGASKAAKAIGVEAYLADLRIDAATVLLKVAETGKIPEGDLSADKEEAEALRRAVIVAQTVPQLAEEIRSAAAALTAPSKSSLLIAQRQALIDKEHLGAKTALIVARRDIVERRIAARALEARFLALASVQQADAASCIADPKSKPDCDNWISERTKVGYNFLSRSFLTARSEQEATRWQETHLDAEEQVLSTEYALKSWNSLIAAPIALLDGYHSGGIKPEALGDLIFKFGGLGLLGFIATKAD